VLKLAEQLPLEAWVQVDDGLNARVIAGETPSYISFRVEPDGVFSRGVVYVDEKKVSHGHEMLVRALVQCFYWTA